MKDGTHTSTVPFLHVFSHFLSFDRHSRYIIALHRQLFLSQIANSKHTVTQFKFAQHFNVKKTKKTKLQRVSEGF